MTDDTINIQDYLSEDAKRQIAEDAFRAYCVKKFRDDSERIFSNTAYKTVARMVDEMHDNNVHALIAEKVKEVIAGLSSYCVFKPKDLWEKEDSKGYIALNEAIEDSRDILRQRLRQIISEIDKGELRELLKEEAALLLDEKLFGRQI